MPRRPDLKSRLARGVRRLRVGAGLTQEAAATAAGMHLRQYQRVEDAATNATVLTLERLCLAFGVDVAELFAAK